MDDRRPLLLYKAARVASGNHNRERAAYRARRQKEAARRTKQRQQQKAADAFPAILYMLWVSGAVGLVALWAGGSDGFWALLAAEALLTLALARQRHSAR
jgi:fatty acid desaturase